MHLDRISKCLPAPSSPIDVPIHADWERAEEQLLPLPEDYKQFLSSYGSGSIDSFLWILNPASSNRYLNLLARGEELLDALRELRSSGMENIPYGLFPEPGGLLPFGITDNGDGLYWRTVGSPDDWWVVVNAGREPEYEEFPFAMTDFLAKCLERSLDCGIFPDDFPSQRPIFRPAR